jgi:hypothetical protein
MGMEGSRFELPEEVNELRSRIESWRASKGSPVERMPEPLWAGAVEWARRFGACAVSRALGIGYGGLRRRLGLADGSETSPEAPRGGFVELSGWSSSPMLVEVSRADGCRLGLQVHPGEGPDAAQVLRAFLGQAE